MVKKWYYNHANFKVLSVTYQNFRQHVEYVVC